MEKTADIYFLYSTFPNKESALKAANTLIEKRLAACANVADGITSVYHWEGKVQQAQEATLIAKTSYGKLTFAMEELKCLHPYEVPCIVALPIVAGHAPFLDWVKEETK
jgi:periplasmic divalent cation tolerance protein